MSILARIPTQPTAAEDLQARAVAYAACLERVAEQVTDRTDAARRFRDAVAEVHAAAEGLSE